MNKRIQITERIRSKLESIKQANGFKTDLGNKVIYYYDYFPEDIDSISFADKDEKYTQLGSLIEADLSIVIQVLRYGDNFGMLVNEVIEDIHKAFGISTNLDLENVYMTPEQSLVDIDTSIKDISVVQFNYNVKYIIEE